MFKQYNKFLLSGDEFMPEMHLILAYSECQPFTKNKEQVQKFKETGASRYIYWNELDKAYFQRDIAYGAYKDSARIASDKVLRDAKYPKYGGYQRGLVSMAYKYFNKKSEGREIKQSVTPNQQLPDELEKLIIRGLKNVILLNCNYQVDIINETVLYCVLLMF